MVEAVDAEAAGGAIEDAGGAVEVVLDGLVRGSVPAGELEALARTRGVHRVREPLPLVPHVISEGVEETHADDWHAGSFDGAGTKIAILDGGFAGYAGLLGTELPATVETDFSRCGGTANATGHGTAVAEIAHDMAPGATLRLVCIEDDVDFVNAIGFMRQNGVDIVNGSFGFFLASRGDGSGFSTTINGVVAQLRDQGILYVASAGNSGDRHFNVNAVGDPTPATSFADPADSFFDYVNISDGDALEVTLAPHGEALIGMSWDAWPKTRQDFDLYVGNDTCGLVGASEGLQDVAGGAEPIEGTIIQNCSGSPQTFEVLVNRWAGTGTPRLDFFVDGDVVSLEHVTGGSLSDPATSPAALSVGAYCETTGAIQPYSSRGPTIDGRVKPEISGPDGTSSSVYGPQSGCDDGFTGTSASAPHVAGAAALLLGANPLLDVGELQQLLVDRAQDAGTPGRDNSYGAGRLRLGDAGDVAVPVPQAFTPMGPARLFDSRPGTRYPGETPNRTTPIGAAATVAVRVRDVAGIPGDATAVALNVTAVSPTAPGWVTVFPGGVVPTVSNMNFKAGQTTAVHVTATVGADDFVRLYNATGNTHLIVDVAGWYGPTGTAGPSTDWLTPLTIPSRAMDTRPGVPLGYAENGAGRTAPVGPRGRIDIPVAGLGGVPADATGVVVNVTAIAPTSATFITAFPGGGSRPGTSNLNPAKGQTVANLVVVPVGTGGVVSFYNSLGSTHLAIDVVAYYRDDSGSGSGYVALNPPTRHVDTRTGTGLKHGPLGTEISHGLMQYGYDGVPGDASAVMLSVTAVAPSSAGWLAVYPGGMQTPNISTVNFGAGTTTANAVLVNIESVGSVTFRNALGNAHVLSDLAGYFVDPDNV